MSGAAAARPFRVGPELGALIALTSAEGVGPLAVRTLVDRHGGPLDGLGAARHDPELTAGQREGVRALGGGDVAEIAAAAAAEADGSLEPGDRLLGYGLPGYPTRLARLHFPPPLLWVRGPLPADAPRAVAVVGTRSATHSAVALARDLAGGLADAGVRVVSGLAEGIDGAAHRGALAVGGETVAVLGHGLRFRYPASNADLYRRLRDEGLLLTEFAPHMPAEPHHFPRRNRIVAGLCDAVLVVQAGERSGALLTAGEAEEIGVEVLACPGDPRLPGSAGCHGLLRDGAGLVTGPADVFAALGWRAGGCREPEANGRGQRELDGSERVLVERLDREPAGLDELAALAGGVGPAAALLARLELAGEVAGLPGGRYERIRGRTQ